jgi:hypothetical protein
MSEGILEMEREAEEVPMQGLKGRWVVAMKVQIVVGYIALMAGVPWAAWVTQAAIAVESDRVSTERFTQSDGRQLQDLERAAREKLAERIDERLNALERDSARILAILERVETQTRRGMQ